MTDTSDRPTVREKPGLADTEPVARDSRRSVGTFLDRYETGDELGRGGMGRVVEAHDKMLGRTVAVKEALDTGADALRRFARETQITARLEHPAIVPVYDAGVSPDGSPYYVMRKVTGRPLSELIERSRTLADRLALLPHVLAACQAIAHAHERGIIHRDLKPANILVGAHGETIVIDWGLAKAKGDTDEQRPRTEPTAADSLETRAGTVFGTPGFMSPEQHESADVDERADVYALGATLHFVLTGKVPLEPMPGVSAPYGNNHGDNRELSAIVDKALAHDLTVRYRNAAELAADLARFTTGQLVAAHDYSIRERIARFVRRHRALVITVAAALALLAIGSWIAVGRVLTARDEALAQATAAEIARKAESERASDLVVSQARLLLATNPTAAVAMVRPLATTSRWREVRAVAAGARASGVPHRLPGPSTVVAAALSYAGTHAVACGADGTLHVYDLAARTHAVVARLPEGVRAQFLDEQRLVAWTGSTVTLVDLATKALTKFEHATAIVRVDARDGSIYFVDDRKKAWKMTAASGAVIPIPVPGAATLVAISPDGKRVAVGGEHLWLIDVKHPELVEKVQDGKAFEVKWSANSEHIAMMGAVHMFHITVHPEVEAKEYLRTNQSGIVARDTLYSTGLSGFTIGDRPMGAADLAASMAGLHVTAGEFVVGASRTGLRLFDGTHEYPMSAPAPAPTAILLASPRSRHVLAVAADYSILLWNIDHIMPKRIEVPSYSQIFTVGSDHVWTITNGNTARAIDVQTGDVRELGTLPTLRASAPPSGAYVIARPLASKETLLIKPDGTMETIDVDGTFASSLDDRRVILATKQHELVVYDVAQRTKQTIATLAGAPERIHTQATNPRWIVVTFADGMVSRHDLVAGSATQTRMAPRSGLFSPSFATTAATTSGDVFVAAAERLRRWRSDGSVENFATFPRPLQTANLLDDERILVTTDDGNSYLVRTQTAQLVRLPATGHSFSWGTRDPTLLVTDDRTGGVTVIDVVANAAWKIARATPQGSTPGIVADASTIVMRDATLDSTAIALWRLDLPTTPEATARWIDDMTNATFDPHTGMLGWSGP